MRYVKKCPTCGFVNEETADECLKDGTLLASLLPEPIPTMLSSACESRVTTPAPVRQQDPLFREPTSRHSLFLLLPSSDIVLSVQDGDVLGQAHQTSTSELQLPQLEGVSGVHRRHCRFLCNETGWHVIPIRQAESHGVQNPTYVNERKIQPEEACVLLNGDALRLSGLTVRVRIV